MAVKKKSLSPPPEVAPMSETYQKALEQYAKGTELMRLGKFEEARTLFADVSKTEGEPELSDRAATWILVCENKLAGDVPEPRTLDQRYERAVLLLNAGEFDRAIALLDHTIQEDPSSVKCLYARASAWALQGKADRAVIDLRQAIAIEPQVRFQTVNDPDFEKIREEPALIDIIEPTPTGA